VQQRLQLQRVQLEADGGDRGDVLGCVLARQEQVSGLNNSCQMTIGCKFEALLFGPMLDARETLFKTEAPFVGAIVWWLLTCKKKINMKME
jgi:hypothetical protein